MKKFKILIFIVFVLFCFAVQFTYAKNIILHNGTIYTITDNMETANAVFIQGSKIRAVGDAETILGMRKPGTVVVDLEGKIVFPGFIDPHTHLFNGAQPYFDYGALDRVQAAALENGITSFGNMYTDQ